VRIRLHSWLKIMNDEQNPTRGGSMNAAYSPGQSTGAGVPGAAGDPDVDPNSATARSEDNSDSAPGASVHDVEASSIASGPGAAQITTREDSDEHRSERSVGAETPADGTLG
jgi:hypothetical protein